VLRAGPMRSASASLEVGKGCTRRVLMAGAGRRRTAPCGRFSAPAMRMRPAPHIRLAVVDQPGKSHVEVTAAFDRREAHGCCHATSPAHDPALAEASRSTARPRRGAVADIEAVSRGRRLSRGRA